MWSFLKQQETGECEVDCCLHSVLRLSFQVLVVAGGWRESSRLDSTEILQYGSTAWDDSAPSLPRAMDEMASVSLGSSVVLLGKYQNRTS